MLNIILHIKPRLPLREFNVSYREKNMKKFINTDTHFIENPIKAVL